MSAAADSIVVGLGEALWDCFADSRRPGGAPANVAFGAFQLGYRGIVCSRVGADALGDELLAYLTDQELLELRDRRLGLTEAGRVKLAAVTLVMDLIRGLRSGEDGTDSDIAPRIPTSST